MIKPRAVIFSFLGLLGHRDKPTPKKLFEFSENTFLNLFNLSFGGWHQKLNDFSLRILDWNLKVKKKRDTQTDRKTDDSRFLGIATQSGLPLGEIVGLNILYDIAAFDRRQ